MKESTIDSDDDFDNEPVHLQPNIAKLRPKKSKWSDFVETSQDTPDAGPSETMYLNNTEVVLEVPRKIKNLGKRSNFKCSSITKPSKSNHSEEKMCNNRESCAKVEMDSYSPNTSLLFSRQLQKANENANFIKSNESTLIKVESRRNQIDRSASKKFETPVVHNSKWAQFVKTEVESEDQENFDDTNETIEDENNGNFTSKDNSTEDLEQQQRCNFYKKNNKSSLFKNSHVTKQDFKVKKNKELSICIKPTVKNNSKWAPLVETDNYVYKEDIYESIENVDDNVGNPITANTLFALCEDSELDEILDI